MDREPQRSEQTESRARQREADEIGPWLLGAAMGVLALIGLFMAGRARDDVFYGTGLALFLFGVGFIFVLIHRYVGRRGR